ncbi:hypothetical protein PV325_012373 [Microctonus aethiopoides]|uniref:CB1 cannabinoid receptor-interacting protein 1 n=1 Tax=Microctonus aethiopoides TaxID=144406 RepID=A0AA39FVT5_9HYME|nr:hypothetical protein PV325_012373 [Microctonus aethiopoides]KAK0176578.1 hypothetical protein PV328_000697 [Microctonus aethiopoides]
MGSDINFRVTLSIRKEPEFCPVYCKMEHSPKFRQQKTVKLSCDAIYRFDISFKPPQSLELLSIDGKQIEAVERLRDGIACAYSAYFNTKDVQPCARGQREELPIIIKVNCSGYLSTCLQIKYYKSDNRSHYEWGALLHCIEFDCSCTDYQNIIVNKETYRKFGVET